MDRERALLEIWKDIEGYEGLYQVSNLGRVKSLERTIVRSDGQKRFLPEKILSCSLDDRGYVRAKMCRNNKHISKRVHRLVAETFIDNPDNKIEVNHKDGIKTNNKISNLEWATGYENLKHAHRNKLILPPPIKYGSDNHQAKLTERQIIQIDKLLRDGKVSQSDIAKKYNVSKALITGIKKGKRWGHLTKRGSENG